MIILKLISSYEFERRVNYTADLFQILNSRTVSKSFNRVISDYVDTNMRCITSEHFAPNIQIYSHTIDMMSPCNLDISQLWNKLSKPGGVVSSTTTKKWKPIDVLFLSGYPKIIADVIHYTIID